MCFRRRHATVHKRNDLLASTAAEGALGTERCRYHLRLPISECISWSVPPLRGHSAQRDFTSSCHYAVVESVHHINVLFPSLACHRLGRGSRVGCWGLACSDLRVLRRRDECTRTTCWFSGTAPPRWGTRTINSGAAPPRWDDEYDAYVVDCLDRVPTISLRRVRA